MLDHLSERLQGAFKSVRGESHLNESNMAEALKEIRRALLEADVSLRVVKAFLLRVEEKALGEKVLQAVSPTQQLVKVVYDELVTLLGEENKPISLEGTPPLVMLFGLQGSGKTTTAAKLGLHLQKQGHQPLLVAADVYRPAAIDQLQTLGSSLGIAVHTLPGSQDVSAIVQSGIEKARQDGLSPVIIDTAGRLQVDTAMMAELLLLDRQFKPAEKLLVVDAMTGQEAVQVAQAFHTQIEMTGLVLSKMDGDARGGAALSVVEITGCPIKFVGMGESPDAPSALEPFYPDRIASRMLGMGDVVSLVEKAQQMVDMEETRRLEEKMRKQSFSFEDFLTIQKQLKMLGSLDQILGMLPIPGLNKDMREQLAHGGEKQLKRMEAMIASMTPEERKNPDIMTPSRQRRIAKGCGINEKEIEAFIKQFNQMRMMMKTLTQTKDTVQKEQAPGGFYMPQKRKKSAANKLMPGGKLPKNMPNFPGPGGGGGLPPSSFGFPPFGGGGGKKGFPFS